MSTEQWWILVTVFVAVVPWAFSVHAKLAAIAEALKNLPKLWERIDEHEGRLDEYAVRLSRLSDCWPPEAQ